MPVELACNTMNYTTSFQRALEGISRAGFKFIGIGAKHEDKRYPNRHSDDDIRQMNTLVRDHGLKVNSCLCFDIHIGPDESVDQFKKELDALAAVGCRRAIIGGPWYYKKWPTEIYAPDEWERA